MITFLKNRPRTFVMTVIISMLLLRLVWESFRETIPDEEYQVLERADKCTLLSVEWGANFPLEINGPAGPPKPNVPYLAGCVELGRVQLTGASARQAIEVFESAPSFDLLRRPGCFNPRHALQIVANGHTYDFVLCYECIQMEIYKDKVEVKNVTIGDSIFFGASRTLNNLLNENHIPLASD